MSSLKDKIITIGDSEELSFNQFFNEMYNCVCLFANRFLENTIESEDIVQDVFIKLWDNFENFNSAIKIKAYLYSSVRNSCLNHIRHEKVKRKYETSVISKIQSDSFFYEKMVEVESSRLIKEAIEELPPQCKKIMLLNLQGLKNQEIADDLNISINTVKTQKQIAYKILRKKLQSLFELLTLFS